MRSRASQSSSRSRRHRSTAVSSVLVPLVLVLAVFAGIRIFAPGGSTSQAAPADAPAAPSWQPCPQGAGGSSAGSGAGSPAMRCARFDVPLDHARPDGRKIQLGLLQLPATGERRGTIVVNAGTQAGGGVAFLAQYGQAFAGLGRHFDIVGVDTRGTGTGDPVVRCTTHEQDRAIEAPIPAFQTTADRTARLTEATRITGTCAERSADLLPYLSTTADARDLELLRRALGENRLRYLGISNGSLLGQEYADLFPASTGAMVLDSPLDIEQYVRRPLAFDRGQMVASEHTLQTFFRWCAAERAACGFGDGRPEQAFDRLVAKTERNRLAHPDRDDIVTGGNLLQYVLGQLVFPASWPELGKALKAIEAEPLPLRPLQQGENTVLAEFLSHACLDKELPAQLRAYDHQLAAASRVSPHFGSMFGYGQLKCRQWPAEPAEHNRGPWTHPAATPALILAGTDDPLATRAGVAAVRDRTHAAVIAVRGSGHMQLGRTPCVDDQVVAFFSGQQVGSNSRCVVPLPGR